MYISIDHLVLWGWGIFSLGLCVYRNPWLDIKSSQHVYRASGRQDQITKPFRALSGGKSSGGGGGLRARPLLAVASPPTTHLAPPSHLSALRLTVCRSAAASSIQSMSNQQKQNRSGPKDRRFEIGEWRMENGGRTTFPHFHLNNLDIFVDE